MDPEITKIEMQIRLAFAELPCEDLNASQKQKIFAQAAKSRPFALKKIALAAFALAASICFSLLYLGKEDNAPAASGNRSLYLDGVHSNVASIGRLTIFRNANGEAMECRSASLNFDLRFETALAAYSVSEFFEDDRQQRFWAQSSPRP